MADYFLAGLGVILITLGLLGCILPVIPGPPLSFFGLLSLNFTKFNTYHEITSTMLWWMAGLATLVTILDYIVPIWGTKKFGGSKRGVWGSTIGLVIGLFFAPLGIILGPFLGALIGEMTVNSDFNKSFKASLGALLGFVLGVGLKFTVSGLITFHFFSTLF